MTASTVAQYLAAPRSAPVRKVINENLPEGYAEGMQFGIIGWYLDYMANQHDPWYFV